MDDAVLSCLERGTAAKRATARDNFVGSEEAEGYRTVEGDLGMELG